MRTVYSPQTAGDFTPSWYENRAGSYGLRYCRSDRFNSTVWSSFTNKAEGKAHGCNAQRRQCRECTECRECREKAMHGRKCTVCSSADLHEWWCRHPTKCPSLHFPILGTDSHVKHLQKSEKETLRKQHQCRRFWTDTGKLLQIRSPQATARMLVSTYSSVAGNSHGVRVKNVHMCTHKN